MCFRDCPSRHPPHVCEYAKRQQQASLTAVQRTPAKKRALSHITARSLMMSSTTTTGSWKKTCDFCVQRKRPCDGFARRRCRWVLRMASQVKLQLLGDRRPPSVAHGGDSHERTICTCLRRTISCVRTNESTYGVSSSPTDRYTTRARLKPGRMDGLFNRRAPLTEEKVIYFVPWDQVQDRHNTYHMR